MTCNYCNSDNFKYLTSSTNSTYTYCRDCNTNFDIAYKNVIIDSMLKKLLETLYIPYLGKNDHPATIEKAEYVEVKNVDAENLTIQSLSLSEALDFDQDEMDFKYEFSKKDIYYIENVIFELVQDFYDFDLSKVDIIVCE